MNVKPLLILCLLTVFTVGISKANVGSQTFTVLIENGGSIGFNNDTDLFVKVNATTGDINSSVASCFMDWGGGWFRFRQNETLVFTVDFNTTTCLVLGDQGHEGRTITSGNSFNADPNDTIIISWTIAIEPYLPLRFILGMVGLGLLFGSPIYSIIQLKKREWYDAVRTTAIFWPIGICLIIAWLWL